MHIESRLREEAGDAALKLHTARSRNDQVALDIRMYLKKEISDIIRGLLFFERTIVEMADKNIDAVLPGYTHLQRAQPILLSHHFMAYYEMFSRDMERFSDCLKRVDVMPLGAAALAGTTYPIDRDAVARKLGFARVSENSVDSVSDRDFAMEFLSAASICMVHFSRMSEELVLWSSSEFNFIGIPDAFATGSSIMPQKKNPDVPELARGKAGRVFGSLVALLTIMKSVPLAYNRDMQEDKEPLFDAVDTLKACVAIYDKMLPKIEIRKEAMRKAASSGYLNATEMADYLVKKGMPFRKAHKCAGEMVRYGISKEKELHEFSMNELKSFSKSVSDDIYDILSLEKAIERRISRGGTSGKNVRAAIKKARKKISGRIDLLKEHK